MQRHGKKNENDHYTAETDPGLDSFAARSDEHRVGKASNGRCSNIFFFVTFHWREPHGFHR